MLDEPTASLDPDTADRVRTHLAAWARRTGATVFMASHNMREVERLCEEVLIMDAGRIVERGAPARLIRRHGAADLEEVFLRLVRGGRTARAAE
ncbi:Ribosome-associated ATPase [bacterium HR39]|nr:Ribosome-associated ATPase [bacterium HR39]